MRASRTPRRPPGRACFCDNLYMYGPGASPMTEATPQRATDRKGAQRIRLAADLLARHKRGELEVVIGRSSDYFGPWGEHRGGGAGLRGDPGRERPRRERAPSDQSHSLSYLPDLAMAMVVLGDRDEAAGRAWHLPVTDPMTVRAFIERACTVAGVTPKARVDGPLAMKGRRACSCPWSAR